MKINLKNFPVFSDYKKAKLLEVLKKISAETIRRK